MRWMRYWASESAQLKIRTSQLLFQRQYMVGYGNAALEYSDVLSLVNGMDTPAMTGNLSLFPPTVLHQRAGPVGDGYSPPTCSRDAVLGFLVVLEFYARLVRHRSPAQLPATAT